MTIARQLKIKDFPFIIKDKDGNEIYFEKSDGFWIRYERDANGNIIYSEEAYGYWSKYEYDANGNEIYFESSHGFIRDNRPKIVEMTLEDIAKKLAINVEQLRIKE